MMSNSGSISFKFSCTACGGCCGGAPGFVWLSLSDIDRLASRTGLSRETFLDGYCRLLPYEDRYAYSLKETAGFDCVFLSDGRCSVYDARPVQCSTYPFWDTIVSSQESWNSEAAYCPGMGRGGAVSPETIGEAIASRRQDPVWMTGSGGIATAELRERPE